MSTDERDLSMALRDLADAQPPNEPPTDDLINRGQRARRSRTVATTGGALALFGVVAAATVGLVGPGGDPASTAAQPGPTAAAVTPELRLAAAAQATAKSSFRFRVSTSRNWVDVGKPGSAKESFEGEFDPNGPTGRVTRPVKGRLAQDGEERIVDGDLYRSKGGRWRNYGQPAIFRSLHHIYVPFADPATTVNPASQLEALRSVGTVTALGTAGSGESAVERYSFSYVSTPSDADLPKKIPGKGIIEIGVKSQKVSKISFSTTIEYPNHHGGDQPSYHEEMEVTWLYSDYGLDVDVPIPPVAR
ncbi:hypothetical protein KBX37_19055 [Micromonospora sp. U56]|uniref:hypothetical protein n=1 Tax=Micromonospora sp. U56 TaxID=2824900 RepID=UPI001B378FEE|nr:hypothetical protein [Micromonospora sp. U56]MBQ0895176.1 hypothetical protein [Micromonospora sp. U56]